MACMRRCVAYVQARRRRWPRNTDPPSLPPAPRPLSLPPFLPPPPRHCPTAQLPPTHGVVAHVDPVCVCGGGGSTFMFHVWVSPSRCVAAVSHCSAQPRLLPQPNPPPSSARRGLVMGLDLFGKGLNCQPRPAPPAPITPPPRSPPQPPPPARPRLNDYPPSLAWLDLVWAAIYPPPPRPRPGLCPEIPRSASCTAFPNILAIPLPFRSHAVRTTWSLTT